MNFALPALIGNGSITNDNELFENMFTNDNVLEFKVNRYTMVNANLQKSHLAKLR